MVGPGASLPGQLHYGTDVPTAAEPPGERLHTALSGATVMLALAVAATVAFHAGILPPIRVGTTILFALGMWGLFWLRVGPVSLLPRLLTLLFILPFSVLLGYFGDPEFVWMRTPRGMEVIEDAEVVSGMLLVGIIGLLALLSGFLLSKVVRGPFAPTYPRSDTRPPVGTFRGLDLLVFFLLLALALGLSALSAPSGTIFEAGYRSLEQGQALAEEVNFPAAGLASYLVLVLLLVDAERESSKAWGRLKQLLAIGAVGIVVVFFQLLRGDRDSFGLLAAVVALFLTSPMGRRAGVSLRSQARRRLGMLALPGVAVVALFLITGWARNALAATGLNIDLWTALKLGLQFNTWTAVLWTNLTVAWEHAAGVLEYQWGGTYLNYLLSLPPGVVTNALGFERALESWNSLALVNPLGISSGGLHVVVAPFRNFGAPGVLGVLLLFGLGAGLLERWAMQSGFLARQLWASAICGSFLWFWYGDMPMIRAMMISVLLYWGYRIALGFRPLGTNDAG